MAGEDQPTGAVLTGSATMSAETTQIRAIESGFPSTALPTIFADGIANAAPSTNVVRFYLYRFDPEQAGKSEYKNQVVAQVVMPLSGFVASYVFLEKAVKQFVSQGVISEELMTNTRKAIQGS